MATITMGERINNIMGNDDEKRDLAFLDKIKKDVSERVVAEARGKDQKKPFSLKSRELKELQSLIKEFVSFCEKDDLVGAYFTAAPLFSDELGGKEVAKLAENRDHGIEVPSALSTEGAKAVVEEIKREIALQAFTNPLPKDSNGKGFEERARKLVTKVLANHGCSDASDPHTVLAIELWSEVDVTSPAMKDIIEDLVDDATRTIVNMRLRLGYEMLSYWHRQVVAREAANIENEGKAKRKANMNPGIRAHGFFERIGESLARGFNRGARDAVGIGGGGAPSRAGKKKTKNALRDMVREAEG